MRPALLLWVIASAALVPVSLPAEEKPTLPKRFVLGAISVTPKVWDKEANLAKLDHWAREAASRGARLIVTPEGFLEGYVGNERKNPEATRERYFAIGEPIDGPILARVRALARELGVYLSLGFAERRGERMYNSTVLIDPSGEIASLYSKSHTAHDEPFNTKGVVFPVADTSLARIGSLVCYDRQLPETSRILAIKGAQLILVPAWGNYNDLNDAMMRTRAHENSVWLAFVHPKRALIIDPRGNVVAADDGEHDQVVTAEVVLDERVGSGAVRDRKPDIYGDLLSK